VAALLGARELVLEVHAGRARLDHLLHQLERVEHAAEAASASATIGCTSRCVACPRMADLVGARSVC
jgi:hypothetical protein